MWYIYPAIKKEWNNAICSNMDGPRYCDPKWSKLAKYHDTTYMWTLKYDTNEVIYKTETHSQTLKTNLWLPKSKGGREG